MDNCSHLEFLFFKKIMTACDRISGLAVLLGLHHNTYKIQNKYSVPYFQYTC